MKPVYEYNIIIGDDDTFRGAQPLTELITNRGQYRKGPNGIEMFNFGAGAWVSSGTKLMEYITMTQQVAGLRTVTPLPLYTRSQYASKVVPPAGTLMRICINDQAPFLAKLIAADFNDVVISTYPDGKVCVVSPSSCHPIEDDSAERIQAIKVLLDLAADRAQAVLDQWDDTEVNERDRVMDDVARDVTKLTDELRLLLAVNVNALTAAQKDWVRDASRGFNQSDFDSSLEYVVDAINKGTLRPMPVGIV